MSNSTLKARSSFPTETRRRFAMAAMSSQAQLQAFPIRRRANPVMHEPFGDLPRQRIAMMRPDQFEHHVEGADAARGREPVPVDDEDAAHQLNVGKGFDERRLALPVERAGVVVEQAGAGEIERAVGDAADMGAKAQALPDPRQRLLCRQPVGVAARADDDIVRGRRIAHGEMGRDGDAVGSDNQLVVRSHDDPVVELSRGYHVRRSQRLYHGAEGHHRKAGKHQNGHPPGDQARRIGFVHRLGFACIPRGRSMGGSPDAAQATWNLLAAVILARRSRTTIWRPWRACNRFLLRTPSGHPPTHGS